MQLANYVYIGPIQIAPYASVIINGVYWGVNTPRLMTIPDAKTLLTPEEKVCDENLSTRFQWIFDCALNLVSSIYQSNILLETLINQSNI